MFKFIFIAGLLLSTGIALANPTFVSLKVTPDGLMVPVTLNG